MNQFIALLLVSLLNCPALAADSARVISQGSAQRQSALAPPSGALTASAAREVSRLVRSMPPEPPKAQPILPQPKAKGWIARHPKLFGALVGFGAGCIVGASQVGGSKDDFFNALDEFACPAVGGIGAGAGAFVASLVK
jgi:hypothetical protein